MMNMKKLLALLLAIVMVVGMFPMNVFAENEEPAHLESCVEGCTGCECTCHQVNPASDDPAEPESPADNCLNCDNADCIGCDGEAKLQNDGGEAKDEVCETCQKDPCECKGEVCETCQKDPCECKSEVCETCQKDPCECKGEVCETCQKDPCECKTTEETKCGICGGEHADKDCTYCLSCKTDNSQCTICDECGVHAGGHNNTCSKWEDVVMAPAPEEETLYEKLMATDSVEAMYQVVLEYMFEEPDTLKALTENEILGLLAYIKELDPEQDDTDYADLVDTLTYLPAMECPECGEFGGHTAECTRNGEILDSTISNSQAWKASDNITEDTTWIFENGAVVTFEGPETIKSGVTLTLKGWGSIARHSSNKGALFVIEAGGKLVIEGTSKEKPFTIDGKNVIAETSLIISSGELNFNNAVIQNGKNRSVYPADHKNAGKPNGQGGGITVGTTGSLTMTNSVITRNTASLNGGGFYSTGPVTISNSEISWNRAMSAETAYSTVNAGRGGGFALAGENADAVLTDVLVTQNAAMYYGGGGQVSGSGSSLIMNGNTVFSYNEAVLHGAGALHLTGDATFTMNGGSLENNKAQYCGGGIHSSYSCVINLNSGSIINNTANGRGAGVHVNTGGAITLGAGITISGNKVYSQGIGSYADLDATGDNWSNMKYEGHSDDFGYGGGVLIDSGTCTVEGATITNNYALNGGGGIALTMLNMGDGGLDDLMVINFTMSSGTVSNNTTDGNGAGVYIMSNKAKENLVVAYGKEDSEEYKNAINKISTTNRHIQNGIYADVNAILDGIPKAVVSGGTISNNTAQVNGGGLYLGENTKFIISGGNISENEAVDGAGVYVESGTAEINGGSMNKNIASNNGGALYVKGNVAMTAGIIGGMSKDAANHAVLGGGVYVTEGNMTIAHGDLNYNAAESGGAVYMAGDADTIFKMESGNMNHNTASDDGGAIYATSGTLYIGLQACDGTYDADQDGQAKHTALGTNRHHPIITGNKAGDVGGAIAIAGTDSSVEGGGTVHFYCGEADGNEALYKGVGKNVFMHGGAFYYYDGADIGETKDPDLVIIGGELWNEAKKTENYITLQYYKDNVTDDGDVFTGLAEPNAYMNLPEGEYFWEAPSDHRFVGWTPYGPESANDKTVRAKEDYKPSGEPVQITDDDLIGGAQNTYDGKEDMTMHLYAIWAPIQNHITIIDDQELAEHDKNPVDASKAHKEAMTYEIDEQNGTVTIPSTISGNHPGYAVVGWYLYQNEGKNANWGRDFNPEYTSTDKKYANLDFTGMTQKDTNGQREADQYYALSSPNASLILEIPAMTFGDITLVAKLEPQYFDLTVDKTYANGTTGDAEQVFLFHIVGEAYDSNVSDIDMIIHIVSDGILKVNDLPAGTYTVTELVSWSPRFKPENEDINVELNADKTVVFKNSADKDKWLDGNSSVKTNVYGMKEGA